MAGKQTKKITHRGLPLIYPGAGLAAGMAGVGSKALNLGSRALKAGEMLGLGAGVAVPFLLDRDPETGKKLGLGDKVLESSKDPFTWGSLALLGSAVARRKYPEAASRLGKMATAGFGLGMGKMAVDTAKDIPAINKELNEAASMDEGIRELTKEVNAQEIVEQAVQEDFDKRLAQRFKSRYGKEKRVSDLKNDYQSPYRRSMGYDSESFSSARQNKYKLTSPRKLAAMLVLNEEE